MFDKKTREKVVCGFHRLLGAFGDMAALEERAMRREIPMRHYMFLRSLSEGDVGKMDDVALAMLCGKFDDTFAAGDYGYAKEQNRAINALEDIVAELR